MRYLALLCVFAAVISLNAANRPPEPIQFGQSLKMGNLSFRLGGGYAYGNSTKYLAFTTHSKGQPLVFLDPDEPKYRGSGEFRPSLTQTGYYEARYIVYDWPDTNNRPLRLEYGSIYILPPATDSDNNGIPDIADGPTGFNGAAAGIIETEWLAPGQERVTKDNYTFNFTRAANDPTGTYTVDALDKVTAFGGMYRTWDAAGNFRYLRNDKLGYIDFFISTEDGIAQADSRYRRISDEEIRVNPLNFRIGNQKVLVGSSMTLHRVNGNSYRGMFTAKDGLEKTRFPDLRWFVLNLVENNDSDTDRLSDLAEPLKPYIVSQSKLDVTINEGANATFKVSALGIGLNYQWRHNGINIPDATLKTYTVRDAEAEDAGDYDVRVFNDGGEAFSQVFRLQLSF